MAKKICSVCEREVSVNKDGSTRKHTNHKGRVCRGSGQRQQERATAALNKSAPHKDLKVGDVVSVGGAQDATSIGIITEIDGPQRTVMHSGGFTQQYTAVKTPLFTSVTKSVESALKDISGLSAPHFTPEQVSTIRERLHLCGMGSIDPRGVISISPYQDGYSFCGGSISSSGSYHYDEDRFGNFTPYDVLLLLYKALYGEELEMMEGSIKEARSALERGDIARASYISTKAHKEYQDWLWHGAYATPQMIKFAHHNIYVHKTILALTAHCL